MVQQTLRKMVEREPQGAKALKLLKYLTVCREGFTLEAARALYAAQFDDVPLENTHLVLESLLNLLIRYQLVSLNKQRYYIDKFVIAVAGTEPAARQAHFVYYHVLAERLDRSDDAVALFAELANLEVAFDNALAAKDAYRAFWLANFSYEFLVRLGRVRRMVNWLEQLKPFERTLDAHTLGALQNARGNAYQDLARTEDPILYLQKAIEAYDAALRYGSEATQSVNYAITSQNLGKVYRELAQIKDSIVNFKGSIEAYHAALRTAPDNDSVPHTALYYELGGVYHELAALMGSETNLKLALEAYQNALTTLHPEYIAGDYAPLRYPMGQVYQDLARFADPEINLQQALECYRDVLHQWTPQTSPLNYGRVQKHLGSAYADLAAHRDRSVNLNRAVEHYQNALRFLKPGFGTMDYASTLKLLGIACEARGSIPDAIRCWREASDCYRKMGSTNDANHLMKWIERLSRR